METYKSLNIDMDGQMLSKDKHPQRDFFVANILEATPKDDRHSMEHPIFTLSKTPDMKIRTYEHNGSNIAIEPGVHGLATIWDKDILIYLCSQLVEAINRGRKDISRKIHVTAYDLLSTTNRGVSGDDYKRLVKALDRLASMRIRTDIRTNGRRIRENFGLINSWKIVEKSPDDGRMISIEAELSEWLFNAVLGNEVLSLNRDYFLLTGGLERRLYEIARKHCGKQPYWHINLSLLRKKCGSVSPLYEFRRATKKIAITNQLPDYELVFDDEKDIVIFAYVKDHHKACG